MDNSNMAMNMANAMIFSQQQQNSEQENERVLRQDYKIPDDIPPEAYSELWDDD